jgi:DNA-binding NarL/FixJ family response regulator
MKILLADDHELIRTGLRNELRELDAAVLFVDAWNADSLRQMFELHDDLDLALVDLAMPGMDGARTVAELRERYPTVPLIVLSGADPVVNARAVMRVGAAGFIPKSAMAEVMLQAIRLVLAGGQYLPPQLIQLLNDDALQPEQPGATEEETQQRRDRKRLELLSQRQQEVFALLAKGLSNKMIARELNITEGTVKNHVATIFDVLNVHNRVSAVVEARRLTGGAESS